MKKVLFGAIPTHDLQITNLLLKNKRNLQPRDGATWKFEVNRQCSVVEKKYFHNVQNKKFWQLILTLLQCNIF